jgi:hypothetical protein
MSHLFPVLFSLGHIQCEKRHSMKLPSAALALIVSMVVIGCANQPPPTPAQSALEKKDKREYSSEVDGRIQ